MNTSEIISSILAGLTLIGILVALGLGVWSIFETRNTQRRTYKESALGNILKWLEDVSGCEARFNIENISDAEKIFKNEQNIKSYHSISAGEIANEFITCKNKGRDLVGLFRNKQDALPVEMNKLIKILTGMQNIYLKYRVAFLDAPEGIAKLSDLLYAQKSECDKLGKNMAKSIRKIRCLVLERRHLSAML